MEIQAADRRFRIIVVLAFLAAVAAGALSLLAFQDWLVDVQGRAPSDAKRTLLAALAWIGCTMFLSLLFFALYLWRLGARVRAAGQFPLPGTRVVVDTVVLRGDAARRRGTILQRFGVLLVCCALALFAAGWRVYSLLLANAT